MPVTSVTPAVSRPTLVPPQTTPTAEKKDRTPSLKESDPAIWARREAIKTRYFAEFTAETWESLSQRERAYRNEDAERLARLCADTDEALALMRAVYDEGWTDRATGKPVYRNRWLTTVSLLKILPKRLKDFRDGAIQTATPADPTAPRGTGYGKVRTSGLGRTDGFRYEPHPVITWCDHDSNGGGEGCRMAAGEEHDTPLCGRTGTVVLEKDANGEARRVS